MADPRYDYPGFRVGPYPTVDLPPPPASPFGAFVPQWDNQPRSIPSLPFRLHPGFTNPEAIDLQAILDAERRDRFRYKQSDKPSDDKQRWWKVDPIGPYTSPNYVDHGKPPKGGNTFPRPEQENKGFRMPESPGWGIYPQFNFTSDGMPLAPPTSGGFGGALGYTDPQYDALAGAYTNGSITRKGTSLEWPTFAFDLRDRKNNSTYGLKINPNDPGFWIGGRWRF